MQSDNKTKIAVIAGIGLIVLVASMVILPFRNTDSAVQKVSQSSIKKLEDSEEKMFRFITHEKTELGLKTSGQVKLP